MLTASYNQPASDWTRAIDRALGEWDKVVEGNAHLTFDVRFDADPNFLAQGAPSNYVSVGRYRGSEIVLPQAAAKFQGYQSDKPDIRLRINPDVDWTLAGTPMPGKFSFQDTAEHEIGHGTAFIAGFSGKRTPWSIWSESLPAGALHDKHHFASPTSLMHPLAYHGKGQQFDAMDLKALGGSSIPTAGDDTFWLINGARLDGGGGNDKAIWLHPFDQYNAQLSRINRLELLGDNPLTESQQGIYKLYRAGLGRDPDYAGFKWWNDSGKSLHEMAAGFIGAPEFAPTANLPSTREFITGLYENVLGRAPEQAGLDYWAGRTDLDRAGLLANIAYAPENEIGTVGFIL